MHKRINVFPSPGGGFIALVYGDLTYRAVGSTQADAVYSLIKQNEEYFGLDFRFDRPTEVA